MSLNICLGAQKNRLIETVLFSTHNLCFGREIRKLFFNYALISHGQNSVNIGLDKQNFST